MGERKGLDRVEALAPARFCTGCKLLLTPQGVNQIICPCTHWRRPPGIDTRPAGEPPRRYPHPRTVAELLKPITWFPPMWAFACGVVASGVTMAGHWALLVLGMLLAGPMVCATSQAVNDWFDRHVDAINEPDRPIPSGRMPGRWGLYIACVWTGLSLAVSSLLGWWGFGAAALGLALAWAYSAPPLATQTQRLVGQCRLRPVLRRPGLGDGRRGHGRWDHALGPVDAAGPAVQPGSPRHHDLERFQVDRRRPA